VDGHGHGVLSHTHPVPSTAACLADHSQAASRAILRPRRTAQQGSAWGSEGSGGGEERGI
jgi:hypothetical protein